MKILIDAVQAATFITDKKTPEPVEKIAAPGGAHRAEILQENIVCFNTRKHGNEAIYEDVYNCVLQDIQDKTSKLEKNREEFIAAASRSFQGNLKAETRHLEKRLKELTKRYEEIEILIQKAYENSVLGTLSSERMTKLITNYENEQKEVKVELEEVKSEIHTIQEKNKNVLDFTKLIEQYIGVKQITMAMALELIEKIEIGERYIKNGQKYQDIDISYRFVGNIAV